MCYISIELTVSEGIDANETRASKKSVTFVIPVIS